ncbi:MULTISPECIES: nucleotidyltransferase [unclassified Modestobacter]|uniref:nucleotidyltransferase n=1 Tax=unclassified Modestobacter TaxID=2643866 RepID=UPI0022AAB2A1|nr:MULTISPECIES: nucleotidyltransferase [unclassified Modestobacter]MCZ2827129.1 nucleotidyltransferase [Modestobacter sp. VKM Ac-2981]MCZ2854380.1 nucleotidyltransferase [Modestobacter sp. VKM Ac-2982]
MTADREARRVALKRTASALKRDGLPFALAGGYALWAHGAPESENDVDFVVAEADTERAAGVLAAAGFEVVRPSEDWLFKARNDGVLVDLLHRLVGEPVTAELLDRAEERDVLGIRMPVLPATELLSAKLRAMTELYCDMAGLLPHVRAVREQLDWPRLRKEVDDNHFAAAFLFLTDRLGISPG